MQLDDERESDYIEDRRSDDGGGFGGGDPFGGTPYGPGGGDPYGGGPYGGGPFGGGGGMGGGFLGGMLGGILGGILSRPRGGDQYGGGTFGNDPYGRPPYGGDPYGGDPYGGRPPPPPGMGWGAKIAIFVAILIGVMIAIYFFTSRSTPRSSYPPPQRAQTVPRQMPQPGTRPINPANDPQAKLVSEMRKVLAKTEDTWDVLFRQMGKQYQRPRLVLFTNTTRSGCGQGRAATGPFYCPPDQRIYLDLRFFNEMERRLHAGGDFARAYVIAHEVGHHVQNQMGIMSKVNDMRSRMSKQEFNKVSVRLELQADCFAGVWAHHANKTKRFLDPGDIDQAMRAASAVGDDTIQRSSRGAVVPDSFTHGSSAQRMKWFKTGFDTGSIPACDTFSQGI